MADRDDGFLSGARALSRLGDLVAWQKNKPEKAKMTAHDDPMAMLNEILESDEDCTGAVFPASDYKSLCRCAAIANTVDRGTVSLVLPVREAEFADDGSTDLRASDGFVALACADLSPHNAFLLVSGLPLSKSSRDALEDNGLSIRGLTMREAILMARRTSEGIFLDGN